MNLSIIEIQTLKLKLTPDLPINSCYYVVTRFSLQQLENSFMNSGVIVKVIYQYSGGKDYIIDELKNYCVGLKMQAYTTPLNDNTTDCTEKNFFVFGVM